MFSFISNQFRPKFSLHFSKNKHYHRLLLIIFPIIGSTALFIGRSLSYILAFSFCCFYFYISFFTFLFLYFIFSYHFPVSSSFFLPIGIIYIIPSYLFLSYLFCFHSFYIFL